MKRKLLLCTLLILTSQLVGAQEVSLYVADDFHPLEGVVENAINAAAVLDGQRMILVKDGQVARMSRYSAEIREAQTAQIRFYVCETDVKALGSSNFREGLSVVRVDKAKDKNGEGHTSKSTVEKNLERLCSE